MEQGWREEGMVEGVEGIERRIGEEGREEFRRVRISF